MWSCSFYCSDMLTFVLVLPQFSFKCQQHWDNVRNDLKWSFQSLLMHLCSMNSVLDHSVLMNACVICSECNNQYNYVYVTFTRQIVYFNKLNSIVMHYHCQASGGATLSFLVKILMYFWISCRCSNHSVASLWNKWVLQNVYVLNYVFI